MHIITVGFVEPPPHNSLGDIDGLKDLSEAVLGWVPLLCSERIDLSSHAIKGLENTTRCS